MLFEDLISELGEFGPYQKRVYFLVCLLGIPTSMQVLSVVFIQATPMHRCAVPGLPNDTFASQGPWPDALVNSYIPLEDDKESYDQCRIRRVPGGLDNDTVPCDRWVYSKHPFENTFVSDADLVCASESLVTYASMVMMAGMLTGSFVMGVLSDIIGRKRVLILAAFSQFAVAFANAFVRSYVAYVIIRFLVAFTGIGMFLSGFLLGMEMVGPRHRKFVGIFIEIFWCIGLFIQAAIAYSIRSWREFQMAITLFNLIAAVVFLIFLPESARWLLQKGRVKEAAKIIETIAKTNGVTLSENAKRLKDVELGGEKEKICQIFSNRKLLQRSLVLFFNWFAASVMYYGLSLNAEDLSGNIYLNCFLMALVEVLSYFFCLPLLDVVGRKFLQCFSMLLGGVACIATLFPVLYESDEGSWIFTSLSLIGKFGASAGFAVVCIYTAEIFPTAVRNSGIGACSLCARLGGIIAPYITGLGTFIHGGWGVAIPLLIFGGLSLLAGLLVLFLPETSHTALPDTLGEATRFGQLPREESCTRDQRFTDMKIMDAKKKTLAQRDLCH